MCPKLSIKKEFPMLPEPKEMWDKFVERDNHALSELNNWMNGPITESSRLNFLEGRVNDLCGMINYLYQYIGKNNENGK